MRGAHRFCTTHSLAVTMFPRISMKIAGRLTREFDLLIPSQ